MRILQVSPCFYPAWAYGGPVPVAFNISKELIKRGHEVVVYATDTVDATTRQKPRYMEVEGMRIFYFRNISNWLAWRRNFLAPGMLFRFRKDIKDFHIIHIHGFRNFQAVLVHHYAKKHGVPYVIQAHGSLVTFFQKGLLKKIFDRLWGYRILKDATKVIALTQTEATQYESLGVSKEKIEIVPNGIDLTEFQDLPKRGEFRKKYGLNNEQKLILFLGRINSIKGLYILIKAFKNLYKEANEALLIIVGPDDGYLETLKQLIKKLQITEKVIITGPLYGQDKLEAYIDADIYVLPSIYETFPITVLEACACGLPIILSDRCGIADTIDNQAGIVVTYDDGHLNDAIFNLLYNNGLRRQFGKNAQQLVTRKFNWPNITEQIEKIYISC